jgi:hypothetical protein
MDEVSGTNTDLEGLHPYTECCVVAAGVTDMLGLCNPPRRGVNNWPNLRCRVECTTLCGFFMVLSA